MPFCEITKTISPKAFAGHWSFSLWTTTRNFSGGVSQYIQEPYGVVSLKKFKSDPPTGQDET